MIAAAMRTILALPFVFAASVAGAQNFISNGDFSSGNVGFSTGYNYAAPATNALFPEGNYTVTDSTVNPFVLNTAGIVDYHDHTSGSGLFMLVNGSMTGGTLVWGQTLTGLAIGQAYEFDGWVSRWTPNGGAAAHLQVSLDGSPLTDFNDPNVGGVWEERSAFFTASSTSISLEIRDLENPLGGNDFSFDDLSVQAVPEPTSMVVFAVGALGLVSRRRKS